MPYLRCPRCRRTAWLDSTAEPDARCRHCDAALAAMPDGQARFLVAAVRERFARDARLQAGRRRFVRG
jgi:ribosomal protein S27E